MYEYLNTIVSSGLQMKQLSEVTPDNSDKQTQYPSMDIMSFISAVSFNFTLFASSVWSLVNFPRGSDCFIRYDAAPQVSALRFLLAPVNPASDMCSARCVCVWTSALPRSSCRPSARCIRWCLCCRYLWEESTPEQRWSPSCPPASQRQVDQAALQTQHWLFNTQIS